MDYLKIIGNQKLSGEIYISGAKNAALPLIAATILAKNETIINNLPNVADINTFLKLIKMLGGSFTQDKNRAIIDTSTITNTTATYDIVKTMRASILVLGPLLARFGHCEVSLPGGCAIGQRPVDLHFKFGRAFGISLLNSSSTSFAVEVISNSIVQEFASNLISFTNPKSIIDFEKPGYLTLCKAFLISSILIFNPFL